MCNSYLYQILTYFLRIDQQIAHEIVKENYAIEVQDNMEN